MSNAKIWVLLGSLLLTAVGFAYTDYREDRHRVMDQVSKRITDGEVKDSLRMAAEQRMHDIYQETKKEVCNRLADEINRQVGAEVISARDMLLTSVRKEIEQQVQSKVNVDKVVKRVEEKAQDDMVEKLNDKMDDIIDGFTERLETTNEIYSEFARKIARKS